MAQPVAKAATDQKDLLYIGLFVAFVIASFVGYLINKM
jgi:hypothetical protein